MKKITASILTTLLMLSMVFSSSVFAANEEVSAWDSFLGLFSGNATTTATDAVGVEYRGHIQNVGNFPLDGTWIQGPNQLGTVGQSLRLEGFWIKLTNQPENVNIQYRVHVQNEGWMTPVENGVFAGTEGKSQQIEAIEINLVDDEGNAVQGYSVQYKGHIQNQGDTAWFEDGQQLGTVGSFLRLEALEVKIVQTKADMTAYEAVVAEAVALDEADYTAESWAALETALIDNLVTEDNTQAEVDAAVAAINDAIDGLEMVTRIDSVTATGAKALTVKFNQAVDATKATFAVKRASVTANVSNVAWNADNTEATLTLATKLVAGTYTVTETGLADTALTGTVVAENEKVGAIEILSADAVLVLSDYSKVTVGYLVSNQYGEDVTKTLGAGLTYTSGRGLTSPLNGVLTITDGATNFKAADTFALSILDSATGVFASKQLVVAPESSVAAITINGLYNADDETLDVNSTPADFMLLVDVTDQYGNAVPVANIAAGVVTSVSDPTIYGLAGTFAEVTIDGAKQTVLKLANGSGADLKAGKATASIISKYNGARATYEVTVTEKSKTDAITLSAPELAVAKEKIAIPFTVTDQFGNPVVKNSALTSSTVNVTASAGTIAWVPNYATGNASLVLDATTLTTAQKVTITATTQEGKVALLTVDLQAPAVAEVITATEDVITNISVGGTFTLDYTNLVVKDQYGRDFDLKDKLTDTANAGNAGKYKATVTDATPNTVLQTITGDIDSNSATVTATGKAKGTTVVTLQLSQVNASGAWVALTSSDLEVTATVSENKQFESYEVGTIAPIYDDNGAAYQRDVKVYGVKAGGTKVLLTSDLYSVTTNNSGLTYASGKLVASGTVTTSPDFNDVTVKTTFVIAGEAGPVVIDKDVVVTKPALTISTAEWLTTADATIDGGVELISAANVVTQAKLIGTLTLEDQFGGAYALTGATVTITNIVPNGASTITVTNNGTTTAAITNPTAGDTFNMTIVIGGNSYTIPVVVIA